ncbi:cysteine hydrolase family protein [Natrialbaceae archaeon AArc-T1-2]|uniref:cysteine hydrolase family protein n=1 Tax=Natrialbaceae archaeon AArc-T1-2 TaxID=3053904 RepID=UPI00255B0644|nr:isochorismatase family cysteine hydrolase [Natrialbaceae archaeon AArc-T1-2]WIV68346.1 isochorismatase family cysteine hydrolase [Natrialbaceae archaeon AArc-T1-2]
MNLEPDTTAVVVVDMQNGFCHPEGALYAPGSEAVIEPIAELLERAQAAGVAIVYTRDVHPPEQFEDTHYYDEFERWGEHVVEGTWGAEIVDELPAEEADLIVEKHTYNAFYETELEGWLSARGITDLVFCGTLANVCVLHTGGSAGLRDFRPVLVEDCIGHIEEDHREYALEHADWLFGEVVESDDLEFASTRRRDDPASSG